VLTIANATVSSSSAVSATMTIYTEESACSSSASTGRAGRSRDSIGTAPTAHRIRQRPLSSVNAGQAVMVLTGLLFVSLLGRRPRRLRALAGISLEAVACFATTCGGGNSVSTSSESFSSALEAAKGTYTVTIVGTDTASSSLTASTTMTLTID